MKRRRFLFWVGFGLFSLGEKLRTSGFDELAAATLKGADTTTPIHWRAASNSLWQWYERETLVDGRWTVTGITTPINRETGELYTEQKGYLDEKLVPPEMRLGSRRTTTTKIPRQPRRNPASICPTRSARRVMAGPRANGCGVLMPTNFESG